MITYIIKIDKDNIMNIVDINICNNDELENIDQDVLQESINNNNLESEEDILSFCNGCDLINSYYTKQTAKKEFDSYMNLSKAEKEDEYTINLHGELI